jgi:hypothetical protein
MGLSVCADRIVNADKTLAVDLILFGLCGFVRFDRGVVRSNGFFVSLVCYENLCLRLLILRAARGQCSSSSRAVSSTIAGCIAICLAYNSSSRESMSRRRARCLGSEAGRKADRSRFSACSRSSEMISATHSFSSLYFGRFTARRTRSG